MDVNLHLLVLFDFEIGGFSESRNKDKVQDKYVLTTGCTECVARPGIYRLLTVSRG